MLCLVVGNTVSGRSRSVTMPLARLEHDLESWSMLLKTCKIELRWKILMQLCVPHEWKLFECQSPAFVNGNNKSQICLVKSQISSVKAENFFKEIPKFPQTVCEIPKFTQVRIKLVGVQFSSVHHIVGDVWGTILSISCFPGVLPLSFGND